MKKLLTISFLAILSACGVKVSENEEPQNVLKNLQFSVDTVQIDVGEELFNPEAYYLMDLKADQSKVYFFYPENEIHEMDLISLKLLNRHVFEEDGPDAIPSNINYMQILPNEEVFFSNYAQTGVYKITGEKINGYKLQPENVDGIPNDAGYSLTNSVHISWDKSTIVSLPTTYGEPIEGLAVINTAKMNAKILELPALELTDNFQIVFRQGNGTSIAGDHQRLQFLNGKFLIYSASTAEIYSYDLKTDSLQLHSFPHQLVPVKKIGTYTKQVDSFEGLRAASGELKNEISYGNFYWDESRKSYFRFAEKGSLTNGEAYIFSYDEDLKLTGETKMKDFRQMPYRSFIKDGKLYILWVQEENPAFIVYTFNF